MRGLVAVLLLAATPPAVAQKTAEGVLPPGRPIPHYPMIASRIGKPFPLIKPTIVIPEAARLAGHHGTADVAGNVATDGYFTGVHIVASSRSALLDEAALAAARTARFLPARDADGAAIAAPYTMAVDLSPAQAIALYDNTGYRCASMIRDVDWWRTTWPELAADADPLFVEARRAYLRVRVGGYGTASRSERANAAFPELWIKVVALCRAKPDIGYADAWRENGLTVPTVPAVHIPYAVSQ